MSDQPPGLPANPEPELVGVRETLAKNIKRIRKLRDMSGREFIAGLQGVGIKLLPSGLTAMEKGERRLTVEELLAVAVVLNTSVVDLLMPADGAALVVAEGVDPLEPLWAELWLQGETPWPPEPWGETMASQLEAFLASASQHRRTMHRRDLRPELQAIAALRERVRQAIVSQEDPSIPQQMPPIGMVASLKHDLEEVDAYVRLLANRIKNQIDDGG